MLSTIFITICCLFVCWIYYQRKRNELLLKINDIPDAVKNYPIIGSVHLITCKSPQAALWKSHRKMLNSSFHITLLHNKFMHQFNEVAQLLVSDLQCNVGINEFNIVPFISYRSTDLRLKAMSDGAIGKEDTHIISENNKKAFEIMGDMAVNFCKYFVSFCVQKLLKVKLLGERIMNASYKTIKRLIDIERKQYIDKIQLDDFEEYIIRKSDMFIAKLAKLVERGYFTDQKVKHHIQTMLFAGVDTVSVTISNCILLLAMNEDAQERCAREIRETIGHQLSVNDFLKFELLERTINESMRLISTVPVLGRTCEKDFQLNDTKIIPAGSGILIPIFVVNRSKEYWGPDPTKYPDNFLPKTIAKRPLLSFMPFIYGVCNYIGKKLAQHALKVFIAYLLANYKFSTDLKFDDLKFAFNLSILLRNKHLVRIEKRKF